jgi:hypothetical protein
MDEKLAAVLTHPVARRLADGVGGVRLRAADVERFTTPLRAPRHTRDVEDRRATVSSTAVG